MIDPTSTRVVMFRCDCGTTFRRAVPGRDLVRGNWDADQLTAGGRDRVIWHKYNGVTHYAAACRVCAGLAPGRRIAGIVRAEVPCDARCTTAKGWSCTCSCGGTNHGAQHHIDAAAAAAVADLLNNAPAAGSPAEPSPAACVPPAGSDADNAAGAPIHYAAHTAGRTT